MASFNRVLLIGNLTRDPELRYIPSGTAVASFSIAVNRNYKLPSGEKKEDTTFVRIVVWGRMGEVCSEYLRKGSPVFIEGRLQSRSWEGQDGQKRSTVEVIAQAVQFLGSRGGARQPVAAEAQAASSGAPAREPLEEINLDIPSEPPAEASGGMGGDVPF